MIVSQTFAHRYFGGGEAIGRKVYGWGQWFTIVGVVKDSKYGDLREKTVREVYTPWAQDERIEQMTQLPEL